MRSERSYRSSYLEASREVSRWTVPDADALAAAWERRRQAAEFERFDTVVASHHRGRVQAMEMATQDWDVLAEQGVSDTFIAQFVIARWARHVGEWARADIPTDRIVPPRFPLEYMTQGELSALVDAKDETQEAMHASGEEPTLTPAFRSVAQLIADHPSLRWPVIEGLLREGETMNVIASPKAGKSWLVTDLALAVATGRQWLKRYSTHAGNVLILDNELHGQTTANRIPKVAAARGIALSDYGERVFVENMRGRLVDIFALEEYFAGIEPGRFRVIVLDAVYRFMPKGMDENDNGSMAAVYNRIDNYAQRLGCAFVLIHHTTKGNQSAKSITDVGAGAGSQSRAADAHLILRPHEEVDTVVLEAAVRSWPPMEPLCLRWAFPVWEPADELDPARLRGEQPNKRTSKAPAPKPEEWNAGRFAEKFITAQPQSKARIYEAAQAQGISSRRAKRLLDLAVEDGAVHLWPWEGPSKAYASVPPPAKPKTRSRRERVQSLLEDQPELSSAEVAERLGVSRRYVNRIRSES